MNVKTLIETLQQYPQDLEVWVSDRGYCEGGISLERVEKVLAYEAGLDGDDIDDEYIYLDEDNNLEDIQSYLDKGYKLLEDRGVLSKEIIYLNDEI